MSAFDPKTQRRLELAYEEIMWLARREDVQPGEARGWYTHVIANRLGKRVRQFSGKVSAKAVVAASDPSARIVLEHFERMQTTLTALVTKHLLLTCGNSAEFLETIARCERVHIVTFSENYGARAAGGDYQIAGIELVDWTNVPQATRAFLWLNKLRGKVANASEFRN